MKTKKSYIQRSLGVAFILLLGGMLGKETILSAYEDVSTSGTVVKEMYDEELDVHQYILSNNVRINLKSMALHEDVVPRISLRASFGRGELETPNQQAALPFVTKFFFIKGGLQPGPAFMEKMPSLHFFVDPDDFCFTGTTSSQQGLKILLTQMCGYLTAPIYQAKVMNEVHHMLDQIYGSLYKTPQGVCKDKVEKLLASGDWKFGYPPQNQAMTITVDQIQSFLDKPLKESYLELSIVGDFDIQKCLKVVLETVGTLSQRENSRPYLEELRDIRFPETPLKETFWVQDEKHPTGFVIAVWPTDKIWNVEQMRQLEVLAKIFHERLIWYFSETIQPYAPCIKNDFYFYYKNYGRFMAYSHVQSTQVDAVQKAFWDKALNLRSRIGEEEFDQAIQTILNEINLGESQLSYWLSIINNSQEYPIFLSWEKSLKSTYKNMKKEDVLAVAKKFLHPQKLAMIKILPKTKDSV